MKEPQDLAKTIYSGLRITGMALSNQSESPLFFSPRQVSLKIWHCILFNPTIPEDDMLTMAKSWKITYREWPNPGRCLTENGQIPEDDLPRLARSRHMTSRNWPGSRKSITVIWCHRQVNLLNLKRGFNESSSLKPSTGDERFRTG